MKRYKMKRSRLVGLILTVFMAWSLFPLVSFAAEDTTLSLNIIEPFKVGQGAILEAVLTDASGAPIQGARIELTIQPVGGPVGPTPTQVTDNNGIAGFGIGYGVALGTLLKITADYAGNAQYNASQKILDAVPVLQATPSVTFTGSEPSAKEGEWTDQSITVEVANAYNHLSEPINLTCDISGKQQTASRTGNGSVTFPFTADQLNTLNVGDYDIIVSSVGTTNNAEITAATVGKLHVLSSLPEPVAPTITTVKINDGIVDEEYSFQLEASGTGPITWKLCDDEASNKLPEGLKLSSNGLISGIPEKVGEYEFTVDADNASGVHVSKTFEMTIDESLADDPYCVVLDTPVTDENKDNIKGNGISGNLRYNPETQTITLDGAVISDDEEINAFGIMAGENYGDLTVELIGDNRIGVLPSNPNDIETYSIAVGIIAETVRLTGDGSLTIYDTHNGILAVDTITSDIGGSLNISEYGTFNGCALRANGYIALNKGNLKLKSQTSNALFAGKGFHIDGGRIEAQTLSKSNVFAFNVAPTFNQGDKHFGIAPYTHKVFAGASVALARFVANPTSTTFTANKYVLIEPSRGSTDNKPNNTPATGDNSNSGIWMMLFLMSVLGLGSATLVRIRKSNSN